MQTIRLLKSEKIEQILTEALQSNPQERRMKPTRTKNTAGVAKAKANPDMGRKKREPDLTTYSGRVAYNLRTIRENRGMSVETLAEKMGTSVSALYAWEQNTRTLPPDMYPVAAKAFRMKLIDFLPQA